MKFTMEKYIGLLLLIIFFSGCVSKERETELLNKIDQLETQLAESKTKLEACKNGAKKLHVKMEIAFQDKDYRKAKDLFKRIKKRHPESKYFTQAKEIHKDILKIEEERREAARRKAKREKQKRLAALDKLIKDHDDVSGNTWYKNPYFTHYNNRNLTSIYIGDNGYSTWLRLKMSYQGDGWIFFEEAYLSYEGNTREIYFDEYDDKESDNGYGGVWEWIDVSVPNDLIPFLRKFAKSSEAKMRLSGKYTRTRELTWNERQGILDVLNGYKVLKNE